MVYLIIQEVQILLKTMFQATQAEKLYKTMARKFSKEPEAWALLGKHYFTKKNFKEARFTLQRALQTLDKKTHVEISSR